MKSFTFQDTVTVTDEEFALLTSLADKGYIFNFDGPEGQLDRCDSLRNKGLVSEDSDGRVMINARGRVFLNKAT